MHIETYEHVSINTQLRDSRTRHPASPDSFLAFGHKNEYRPIKPLPRSTSFESRSPGLFGNIDITAFG